MKMFFYFVRGLGWPSIQRRQIYNPSDGLAQVRILAGQKHQIPSPLHICLARDSTLTLVKPEPLRIEARVNESVGKVLKVMNYEKISFSISNPQMSKSSFFSRNF